MKTARLAFAALVTLLTLAPAAAALSAEAPVEETCLIREERCPLGYGTVYATCTNPSVKVPLCFI